MTDRCRRISRALLATLLLALAPAAARAGDAAPGEGGVCEPGKAPPPAADVLFRRFQERMASQPQPAGEEVVPLNNRGYGYAVGDIDPAAVQFEAKGRR